MSSTKGVRCTLDIKTAQKQPYTLFMKERCVSAGYYIQSHFDEQTIEFLRVAAREEVLATELSETPPQYDDRKTHNRKRFKSSKSATTGF